MRSCGQTAGSYGISVEIATFFPQTTANHSRAEAAITMMTATMKNAATPALSRSLKISLAAVAADPTLAGSVPLPTCSCSNRAWERNPSRGSDEKILSHQADIVTAQSQTSGAIVMKA